MGFQSSVLLELEPAVAEQGHSHGAVFAVWILLWVEAGSETCDIICSACQHVGQCDSNLQQSIDPE